jgi:hypothetical protein
LADATHCRLDNDKELAGLQTYFAEDNPGLRLTRIDVDGAAALKTECGGMRVFWNYRGTGQVFVPAGYRTQEGDGRPLPAEYVPEPLDESFRRQLDTLRNGLDTVGEAVAVPIRAILAKHRNGPFIGDYVGELWKIEHAPRPWSTSPEIQNVIDGLFGQYRDHGYSVKQSGSYEPFIEGDQLIACGEEVIQVRGQFSCLAIEHEGRKSSHVSSVRRLRYLADTAGGCNPDFDPFRRLPLTWFLPYPGETGDGLNWINSHVVNIPRETSPAHFHPPRGIGSYGDTPQREMYLVLNPRAYELNTYGREASLIVFPELRDLRRFHQIPLEPGMFVYIPPGTGHRGLDVL